MPLPVPHRAAAGDRIPDALQLPRCWASIGCSRPACRWPQVEEGWRVLCSGLSFHAEETAPSAGPPAALGVRACGRQPARPGLQVLRRPPRGAVALRTAEWGGACGRGLWAWPAWLQSFQTWRGAARDERLRGRERSGPRAPRGAAGRRGRARYRAIAGSYGAGNPQGSLTGTPQAVAALLAGPLAAGALSWCRAR